MFIECIKEGFNLTHRNWQLILVRLVLSIVNLLSLVLFLGMPVFAAIVYMGFELTNAKDILPYLLNNPIEYVSRYIGLLLLIFAGFVVCLMFSSLLLLYVLSGTLGVLRSSAVDAVSGFSFSLFFKEAGKNFAGLFWLILILMTGFVALMIFFAVIAGIGWIVIKSVGDAGYVQVFLKSFISMSYFVFSLIFFFAAVVFAAYSITVLMIEGTGVMKSIKSTYCFLIDNPVAFVFCLILLAGFVASNFIFISFSMMFFIVPLINSVLQSYLSIVLWSSLFVYYMKNRGNKVTSG